MNFDINEVFMIILDLFSQVIISTQMCNLSVAEFDLFRIRITHNANAHKHGQNVAVVLLMM